jgi:hypothetical protein
MALLACRLKEPLSGEAIQQKNALIRSLESME